MMNLLKTTVLAMTAACAVSSANAAIVSAGAGGFDNGWATMITYDDAAARGTDSDRDNPLNALGADDGSFFEIGLQSSVDLTFGTIFDTSVSVFEITFGNPTDFPEFAEIFVGFGGAFSSIGVISNSQAQGGTVVGTGAGLFDTVRIVDQTNAGNSPTGGFDLDAVRVSSVPLPAGMVLLMTAIGGLAVARRKKS